MTGNIKGERV